MICELDARVAREVMEIKKEKSWMAQAWALPCKPYSTDMNAAMEVVKELFSRGYGFNLHSPCKLSKLWMAVFYHPSIKKPASREADTPAMAICLAALEAVKSDR